jgi:lysophospholipid acyltransferase (LPLAT)-like uncharacterized protein
MARRVDEIPLHLKPLFHAYGYGFGALLDGLVTTIRHTCHVERHQAANIAGPRIECIWHEHLAAYVATYLPSREREYVWLNHPIWYMRPVHVMLALNGVTKLSLGSTGHDGQAALERIIAYLKEGYSTTLAVDGPAGPVHEVKRGALELGLASGYPVVGIRFEYERELRLGGWDRKHFPLPGSRLQVIESAPLFVTRENYDASSRALRMALGAPGGPGMSI